uniref:Uncharacterized protein n=1 Tax=Fagus sylvatica TaxID=28930 RepID=A0A2N9HD24_FAGSY
MISQQWIAMGIRQPQVSFQQFAGYITVDEKQQRALFYYFVEAEAQAASKPLVLWLTGGPGCSSVGGGAFLEHGPFKVSGDNLYLPLAAFGVSFCQADQMDIGSDKDKTKLENRNEYRMNFAPSPSVDWRFGGLVPTGNPMAISKGSTSMMGWNPAASSSSQVRREAARVKGGEGEARWGRWEVARGGGEWQWLGHYVPQLAQLIIQSKVKINLKGISIGNGLLDFSTDFNAGDEYYWSHGLISDVVYQLLTKVCNGSELMRSAINGEESIACNCCIYSTQ